MWSRVPEDSACSIELQGNPRQHSKACHLSKGHLTEMRMIWAGKFIERTLTKHKAGIRQIKSSIYATLQWSLFEDLRAIQIKIWLESMLCVHLPSAPLHQQSAYPAWEAHGMSRMKNDITLYVATVSCGAERVIFNTVYGSRFQKSETWSITQKRSCWGPGKASSKNCSILQLQASRHVPYSMAQQQTLQ